MDIPLDAQIERYSIKILDISGNIKREAITSSPGFSYENHMYDADFGEENSSFLMAVSQLNDESLTGASSTLEILNS